MPTEVVYLGPPELTGEAQEVLGSTAVVTHAADEEALERRLASVVAVLDASMAIPFDRTRIERATSLLLYVTATTGADHVDATALSEREIPLLTLRGQRQILDRLTPAAEHSWALLLACARELPSAAAAAAAGRWDRTQFPGIMLRGRTLGIIGCGRIGSWVARFGQSFGMTTIAYDPPLDSFPAEVESVDLDQLLRRADVVSIHIPLDDTTRGLLSSSRIDQMRPGSLLINTSRGEIVDEQALVDAIRAGRIAGAGVDVLSGEPAIEAHPLVLLSREHPRVVVTPHIGGFSPDAVKAVVAFSAGRIRDFLRAV